MRMKNKELLGKHLDVLRFVYDIYYIFFLYRTLVQFKAMGFFFFFFFFGVLPYFGDNQTLVWNECVHELGECVKQSKQNVF